MTTRSWLTSIIYCFTSMATLDFYGPQRLQLINDRGFDLKISLVSVRSVALRSIVENTKTKLSSFDRSAHLKMFGRSEGIFGNDEECTCFSSGGPIVSIGLPVYNRPQLLYRALRCLTMQTYRNLEIIVSDDCSPGEDTREVVHKFMGDDPRIKYHRQRNNLGPILNHRFVFEKASGEYFFWASEDDEWNERFIEIGLRTLLDNPGYDAWFCTIRNTDGFGRVIREYDGFSRFTTSENKINDIVKYLLEPEVMGKANIMLAIFRRGALQKTIGEYFWNRNWGTDMCFNLAFLVRFNLVCTDEVMLDKRVVRETDRANRVDPIIIEDPSRQIFPFTETIKYIREHYMAVRTTRYGFIVVLVMLSRVPIAIRNYCSSCKILNRCYRIVRKMDQLLSLTS